MTADDLLDVVVPLCAGCGRCCHLTVELGPNDDVPEQFVVSYEGVRLMDQHGNGACVALDPATRLCTIYEQRPAVCRAFEHGSERCRTVLRSKLGQRPWPSTQT